MVKVADEKGVLNARRHGPLPSSEEALHAYTQGFCEIIACEIYGFLSDVLWVLMSKSPENVAKPNVSPHNERMEVPTHLCSYGYAMQQERLGNT